MMRSLIVAFVPAVALTAAWACSPPPPTNVEGSKAFFDRMIGRHRFQAVVLGEDEVSLPARSYFPPVMVKALRLRVTKSESDVIREGTEVTMYKSDGPGADCSYAAASSLRLVDYPVGAQVSVGAELENLAGARSISILNR
jgi:hypothetical protein